MTYLRILKKRWRQAHAMSVSQVMLVWISTERTKMLLSFIANVEENAQDQVFRSYRRTRSLNHFLTITMVLSIIKRLYYRKEIRNLTNYEAIGVIVRICIKWLSRSPPSKFMSVFHLVRKTGNADFIQVFILVFNLLGFDGIVKLRQSNFLFDPLLESRLCAIRNHRCPL